MGKEKKDSCQLSPKVCIYMCEYCQDTRSSPVVFTILLSIGYCLGWRRATVSVVDEEKQPIPEVVFPTELSLSSYCRVTISIIISVNDLSCFSLSPLFCFLLGIYQGCRGEAERSQQTELAGWKGGGGGNGGRQRTEEETSQAWSQHCGCC